MSKKKKLVATLYNVGINNLEQEIYLDNCNDEDRALDNQQFLLSAELDDEGQSININFGYRNYKDHKPYLFNLKGTKALKYFIDELNKFVDILEADIETKT